MTTINILVCVITLIYDIAFAYKYKSIKKESKLNPKINWYYTFSWHGKNQFLLPIVVPDVKAN